MLKDGTNIYLHDAGTHKIGVPADIAFDFRHIFFGHTGRLVRCLRR